MQFNSETDIDAFVSDRVEVNDNEIHVHFQQVASDVEPIDIEIKLEDKRMPAPKAVTDYTDALK